MTTLCQLQDKFQQYLLYGQHEIQKMVVDTNNISSEMRLAVYYHAYRLRLIEALASNYPILYQYVGENVFEKMASIYIDQYPSCFRSIRWFGNHFSHFLNSHADYSVSPYLAELAQFEWTQTLVFDAEESKCVTIDDIAHMPPTAWAEMRFHVHPSVHRLDLAWNVVEIWQCLSDNQPPPLPEQTASSIPWLLWRRDLINRFCTLPIDEAWAIDAILATSSFGDICGGLCQWVEEEMVGVRAASLLKGWVEAGIIRNVIL